MKISNITTYIKAHIHTSSFKLQLQTPGAASLMVMLEMAGTLPNQPRKNIRINKDGIPKWNQRKIKKQKLEKKLKKRGTTFKQLFKKWQKNFYR